MRITAPEKETTSERTGRSNAVVPPYLSKNRFNTIYMTDIEILLKNSLDPFARMRKTFAKKPLVSYNTVPFTY